MQHKARQSLKAYDDSAKPIHVIIRLPFERPHDFAEPPQIWWTPEMDERLWQILSQRNIHTVDWNTVSRSFNNLPIPYLMQHAALLYEQQYQDFQSQMQRYDRRTVNASNSPARSPSTRSFAVEDAAVRPGVGSIRTPSVNNSRPSSIASPTTPRSPSILSASAQRTAFTLRRTSLEEPESTRDDSTNIKRTTSEVSGGPSSPQSRTISSSSIKTLKQYDITVGHISSDTPAIPVTTPITSPALHLASPLRDSIIAAGDSTPSSSSASDDEEKNVDNDREALNKQLRDLQLMDLAAFLPNTSGTSTPRDKAQPVVRPVRPPTMGALVTNATRDGQVSAEPERSNQDLKAIESRPISITAAQMSPVESSSSPPTTSPELTSSNSSVRRPTIERVQSSNPTSPINSRTQSPKPSVASSPQSISAHNSVGSSFSDISDSSVTQSAMIDAMMSQNVNASKLSIWSRR